MTPKEFMKNYYTHEAIIKVYLGLDMKNYTDLSFLYKTFEVEDLK